MGILRPVVQAFMRAVFHVRHELAFSRPVGAQFVGDHTLWRHALLLQKSRQQALGRLGVAARLDDLVEHISVLINRSSQPAFLTVDAHHDFIKVPDIAFRWRLAAYAARIIRAVLSAPSADGLVRNDDPPIEQHFLDIAHAQIKAEVGSGTRAVPTDTRLLSTKGSYG